MSQRLPEHFRRGFGTLVAAYAAPTLDVMESIDFHCFSKKIADFSGPRRRSEELNGLLDAS